MLKVLLVEDENLIRRGLQYKMDWTEVNCVVVGEAATGQEGLTQIKALRPDIVITDIRMPDMDGLDVLSQLSGLPQEVPVIIISARDRESEKVKALDMGADDYVVKPFGVPELLARIRTTLRRSDRLQNSQDAQKDVYQIKGLVLDVARHTVTLDGTEVHFTQNEFKILELLCRHPGKVFSTEEIYRQVWNDDIVSDNAIAVHVRHIREKIEINPKEPRYLKVVWGVGYKFEVRE